MISPRRIPASAAPIDLDVRVDRLGLVLEPNGDPSEAGGILNPAAARAPGGELLLYPRCVQQGNVSRVGTVRTRALDKGFETQREAFALEPEAEYELRPHPGYGCEDPRVTYVPVLKAYVMAYTAFGPLGPRIAVALSEDAYRWERLGLIGFDGAGVSIGDDKDAAFFPEPVLSPSGVKSLAFYHRPMLHLSAVDGRAAIPMIERMPFEDRESIRIGYVPLDAVLRDRQNLLAVTESTLVMSPDAQWGSIKIGGGTPPVRIEEGWMSLFHGVDAIKSSRGKPKLRYSSGIVVHDLERPDRILYRSPAPIFEPLDDRERVGVVDNVVFPTGIDPRPDLGERVFDVYYGMGDYCIGGARMTLA
ncbi:MAG: glycosidase [Candidatus Eremiobacteraeota bacterium]|nr:glycosidase [Candidatus Eremiobacteraeota bacterium]MBV8584523.1 glycosidase [Candidatus Eremiobacteraeota bacterium]